MNNESELKNELCQLHGSDLPAYLKVLLGPIIVVGEGKISFKRSLEIAIPQIFQLLAHPTKTLKALHDAYEIQTQGLSNDEMHAIANQAEQCLNAQ